VEAKNIEAKVYQECLYGPKEAELARALITAVIKEYLPLVHRHVDNDLHLFFFNDVYLIDEMAQILGLHQEPQHIFGYRQPILI
jgi:hypothetical protein